MQVQPLLIFQSAKFGVGGNPMESVTTECVKIPIQDIAEICQCTAKRFPMYKSEIWFHDNCSKLVSPSKDCLLDLVQRVLNSNAEMYQYNCSVNIKCQRSSIG